MIFCFDQNSTLFLTDVHNMYIAMLDHRRQLY